MSWRRFKQIIAAFAALFALIFARYRIPGGPPFEIVGEVRYALIDFGEGDAIRCFFERNMSNDRVFLVGDMWMYVSKADRDRCWATKDGESVKSALRVTFQTRPLFFGGNSVANVVAIERLDKPPKVSK